MSSSATSSGISFGSALFITFLILKLTDTIDWSWWWITSPLWIPFGIGALAIAVILVAKRILR